MMMRGSNTAPVTGDGSKHNRDLVNVPDENNGKDSAWDRRIRGASCLAFALGCLWILLFPLVTITTGEAKPRGTFFDENAMLVHHTMVKLTADDVRWAQPQELSKLYPQDGARGSMWMCTVLRGMDLPCYTHTFHEDSAGHSRLHTSVYTVLEPAPGADGKECLVLTTEQNLSMMAKDMVKQPEFAGLSLLLSTVKYVKDHVGWMSKHMIILVADEDLRGADRDRVHVGVKNFVDDYHTNSIKLVQRHAKDPELTRSLRHGGIIRAAICLDYFPQPGEPDVVQLLTSGVNGELPNMDHLNVAVHHHDRQGLTVLLDMCTVLLDGPPFQCEDAVGRAGQILARLTRENSAVQRYLERLFGMLGFMGSVAMGPSGPHAHFLRHSIDALTIRGLGAAEQGTKRTAGLMKSTSAVLNMVRSISNLEEELHHSVFSYMMLSTKAFVSIGEYAYSLALLLLPLALQGRRLMTLSDDNRILSALIIIGTFEAFGLILLWAAFSWPEPSEEALAMYLKGVDFTGYLLILGICACVSSPADGGLRRPLWEGPKAVMACILAYSCSVTALLSWQIATLFALTHVPLIMMARPFKPRSARSWCLAVGMVISSPAQWASWLDLVTTQSSGLRILVQWSRWFRLSGLLNVPFMCLVSMPTHLVVAFVLFSPDK